MRIKFHPGMRAHGGGHLGLRQVPFCGHSFSTSTLGSRTSAPDADPVLTPGLLPQGDKPLGATGTWFLLVLDLCDSCPSSALL